MFKYNNITVFYIFIDTFFKSFEKGNRQKNTSSRRKFTKKYKGISLTFKTWNIIKNKCTQVNLIL